MSWERNLKAENASIDACRFLPVHFPDHIVRGSSAELSSLFKHDTDVWSFSPSVSLPPFTGSYNLAQLNYTRAQKELYVAIYEKVV